MMKVYVNSALTALKKKKNNTTGSKNNLTLTTMDSISSTTSGDTSNDDASNAKNFDSLSEGYQKPPDNKNPLESSSKKIGSDMDSDSNDSGSLL